MRIVESTPGSITDTKQFIWSDQTKLERRDSSGATKIQNFERGEVTSTESLLLHLIILNSTREMTNSAGEIKAEYSYDTVGRVSKIHGTEDSDFQYDSLYVHAPSNTNLATLRTYSPNLRRWLSRDPIAEDGWVNLFMFIDNDPIDWTDEIGLKKKKPQKSVKACPVPAPPPPSLPGYATILNFPGGPYGPVPPSPTLIEGPPLKLEQPPFPFSPPTPPNVPPTTTPPTTTPIVPVDPSPAPSKPVVPPPPPCR